MADTALLTLSGFRALYPEFDKLGDAIVQEALDEAERQTPVLPWGAKRRDGHKWLAAHICCQSPSARNLRDDKAKDGMTIYLRRRQILESVVASGWRATGL